MEMSEYIDISFVIVGESTDDRMYSQIIEEVRRLVDDNTIVSIVHASSTNTVEVSAHWDQSEIDKKIEKIRKIVNVKDVIIQEKHRAVQRSITEHGQCN